MRVDHLPSPGIIRLSVELRRLAARVISAAEIGKSADQQGKLAAFFTACAEAASGAANGSSAVVHNTDIVTVKNSAGDVTSSGTVTVAGSAVTGVSLGSTVALANNSDQLTIPVTGTYTTKATLTVSGGKITAIALS